MALFHSMRYIGKILTASQTICAILNLPKPVFGTKALIKLELV
jgi:hypothetical protein